MTNATGTLAGSPIMGGVGNPSPQPLRPATRSDIAAWILVAAGLLVAIHFHLISALLAGLFVYSLVHRISRRLQDYRMAHSRARMAALGLVSLVLVGVCTGVVLLFIGLLKGRVGDMPEMLHKITHIVESFRGNIRSPAIKDYIPDADVLYENIVTWLREYSRRWPEVTSYTGRLIVHALLGIIIAAFLCFHVPTRRGPLALSFFERMTRLVRAFEKVFFAQMKISAFNTALTGIYLFVVLPLLGCHLPFRATMLAVTFICGLLPVIGNLISNTIIVLLSLDLSGNVAIGSLVFLIVVHKLEYFLNAKIIGGQIESSAWEILTVMIVAEALFGMPGVIMAPVVYAYVKQELMDFGLV